MMDSMRDLIIEAAGIANSVIESASMVSSSTQEVVSITESIAAAIDQISSGAGAQAADTEAGVIKTSELASSINAVAESANQIEQVSGSTFNLTKNALTSMDELDEKAGQTNQIIYQVRDDISELIKRSGKISSIVKVITNVTDQTRLLSSMPPLSSKERKWDVVLPLWRKRLRIWLNRPLLHLDIAALVKEIQSHIKATADKANSADNIISKQNEARKSHRLFQRDIASMDLLMNKVRKSDQAPLKWISIRTRCSIPFITFQLFPSKRPQPHRS